MSKQPHSGDVCDFCSADQVAWEYPCRDFTMYVAHNLESGGTHTQNSLGAWVACADCAQIVESGDMERMALRVAGIQTRGMRVSDAKVLEYARTLRKMYENFAAARSGLRYPAAEGLRVDITCGACGTTGPGGFYSGGMRPAGAYCSACCDAILLEFCEASS